LGENIVLKPDEIFQQKVRRPREAARESQTRVATEFEQHRLFG
jgi:hypothetical protein